MNLQKNYYEITEEEAIKLSIELGERGSEFGSASWKNRGCLKPDNTLVSFQKKLERYFEEVVIIGKGKKRKYSLYGLRDTPLPKTNNYNGRKMEEEAMLLPYVGKKLKTLASSGKYETTYKELAKQIFFLIEDEKMKLVFVNKLFSILKNTTVPKVKVRGIAYKVWESYELNLVSTLKNLLDSLKKQEYVSVTPIYKARYVSIGKEKDYAYYTLSPLEIKELKSLEEQVVQSYGMEYKAYQKYFILSQVPDEVLAIREKVSETVKEKLEIERYYKAIEIEILDDNIPLECLSDSEIIGVCLERFSRLLTQKVKKDSYQKGLSYDKKFHYLAHLVFMEVMSSTFDYEELIKVELKKVNGKVLELKEYYKNYPDEYTILVAEHEAELTANLTDEEYEAMVAEAFNNKPKPIPLGFSNFGQTELNQEQLAHQN
ncbi:hypothetical protein AAHH17_16100 [Lysinibacillus capsici]|uniref:hypothetical protein n=1 Tax=Lysinibacillus capsici TaxID=2115968 RepID=UPI0032E511CD